MLAREPSKTGTVRQYLLEPSTENSDCGEKLDNYKQISSLKEVVIVHHDERKIVVWRRTGRSWNATEYVDGAIPLAIGCELSVAAAYSDSMGSCPNRHRLTDQTRSGLLIVL